VTLHEKLAMAIRHAELLMEYRSERNAMLEMRKHMAWYLKRERNAKVYRQEINSISRFTDLERLVQKILDEANS